MLCSLKTALSLIEPQVTALIIRNKCQMMQIESNNGGRQFTRNIKRLLQEKKYSCSVTTETQTKNKETRILMQAGYIKEYFYFRKDYEAGSDYDKFMRQFTGLRQAWQKHSRRRLRRGYALRR